MTIVYDKKNKPKSSGIGINAKGTTKLVKMFYG